MRVDAPVALVIKPEAVGAFPPLGLRFLLIRVVVLHEPCSSHRKGKQQRAGVNQAECLACHKPLDKVSYLFTLKQLTDAAKSRY